MQLIEAFVNNPVKVAVGVLIVALFGFIALWRMPMQLTPEVEIPKISIRTRWPGASPSEVEREIIQEQEEQLQSAEGVTKMTAECSDSVGTITLEFNVGTDLSEALLKVNSRLQQVPEYPEDADEPVITTSDSNASPIAYFILRPWVASSEQVAEFQKANPDLKELLEPARRAQNSGLRTQRLDQPYIRKNGKLVPATWGDAFAEINAAVSKTTGDRIGAIAGDLATVEEMYALKGLMSALGSSNLDCRQDGTALDPSLGRSTYLFNPGIAGIEESDAVLIIGSNPRFEAPVLNSRIRKHWRAGPLPIGVIGEVGDLRYDYEQLGSGAETLKELAGGKGKFHSILKKAKKPLIIVGQGALTRSDGAAILSLAASLANQVGAVSESWNGFAVLHTAAARVGGLDLGFVPGEGGKNTASMMGSLDILFLLGADEIAMDKIGDAFTVYIGTHGDAGAHRANVILPGATYTEKTGTYVNTEGRVQMTSRAGFAPGDAKEDWAILRALSEVLGKKLPFDSIGQLRANLYVDHPHFAAIDAIAAGDPADIAKIGKKTGRTAKSAFASSVKDFYLTNPVARASAVMAECSALAMSGFKQAAE